MNKKGKRISWDKDKWISFIKDVTYVNSQEKPYTAKELGILYEVSDPSVAKLINRLVFGGVIIKHLNKTYSMGNVPFTAWWVSSKGGKKDVFMSASDKETAEKHIEVSTEPPKELESNPVREAIEKKIDAYRLKIKTLEELRDEL
jgi:hypothetical protein